MSVGGRGFLGDHVLRPSNPWSTSVHAYLRAVADAGFTGASVPVGIDPDGRERLRALAQTALALLRARPDQEDPS